MGLIFTQIITTTTSRFCSLAAVVVVALLSRAGEVYLYMHVI